MKRQLPSFLLISLRTFLACLVALAMLIPAAYQSTAVSADNIGYYRTITVNSGKIPSTLTDFPLLVSLTDVNLKSVSNGGHVASDTGSDIYFTDSTGNTRYAFEIEKYISTNGTLLAWVKAPSLADGTILKMYYGDSAVTGNATAVWSNGFQGVWHMTTANVIDSTANHNNGTAVNGVSANSSGKINGANSLDGTDGYISVPNSSSLAFIPTGAGGTAGGMYTWQAWVKRENIDSTNGMGIVGESTYQSQGYEISMTGSSNGYHIRFRGNNGSKNDITFNSAINDYDTWYQVAMVYNNGAVQCYLNGSADSLNPQTVSALGDSTDALNMGLWRNQNAGYLNGIIDEVEISNVARSATWIQTEYNNQNNPAGFYTISSESNIPVAPTITTQPSNETVQSGSTATFLATASGTPAPAVQWQVSTNGTDWTDISGANLTSAVRGKNSF